MAIDYAKILKTVIRLIEGSGRLCTFEALSATPADAAKPWKGPGAPTLASSVVTKATFVPPSGADFGKGMISDEMLRRCSQVCLVPPSTVFDMNTCTSITDGAVRWRVVWAQELKPGDVSLLFAFGVER